MSVIAIDGPAGAGKGSVARRLADELELPYLDTGSLYRAVAVIVGEQGINPLDAAMCEEVARSSELKVESSGQVWFFDRDLTTHIRQPLAERLVSPVSVHPGVRERVNEAARSFGALGCGLVAEGRDTTTEVFPQADFKFFLTADRSARQNRLRQSRWEAAAEALAERDRRDSNRTVAPLRLAEDAVIIDSTHLEIEQVVRVMLNLLRQPRLPAYVCYSDTSGAVGSDFPWSFDLLDPQIPPSLHE